MGRRRCRRVAARGGSRDGRSCLCHPQSLRQTGAPLTKDRAYLRSVTRRPLRATYTSQPRHTVFGESGGERRREAGEGEGGGWGGVWRGWGMEGVGVGCFPFPMLMAGVDQSRHQSMDWWWKTRRLRNPSYDHRAQRQIAPHSTNPNSIFARQEAF